jgi:hypothetical protein
LLGQGFGLNGPEVLDFKLVLAAPLDESGLGDFKLNGDTVEGPTLSPELDKPLYRFLVFHKWPFPPESIPQTPALSVDIKVRRTIG